MYRPQDFGPESIDFNIYGNTECDKLIITYGRLFSYACKAKEQLGKEGIEVCILNYVVLSLLIQRLLKQLQILNTYGFLKRA